MGYIVPLLRLIWHWNWHEVTYFKNEKNDSKDMSLGTLCGRYLKEVSLMTAEKFPYPMLQGGLSVNINHIKS